MFHSLVRILFLLLAFWSLNLSAAWSSGGGGILRDSSNPWFVQNTKAVSYCILIDAQHALVTEGQVERNFRDAIQYWKREFSYTNFANADLILSTQEFERSTCQSDGDPSIDLTLQIGFLSSEQKTEIKDYETYASLAVRTFYDEKNLRGRGIIYLAPELGPEANRGVEFFDQPWSSQNQVLLYWTLVHELGHVFGLQHSAQVPSELGVMSHAFVDSILQKKNFQLIDSMMRAKPFFQVHHQTQSLPDFTCYNRGETALIHVQQFFGLPSAWLCFGTLLRENSLEIWGAQDSSKMRSRQRIGTITFESERRESKPAMMFWTPADQQVLAEKEYPILPSFIIRSIKGHYVHAQSPLQRNLALVLDPRHGNPTLQDLRIVAEFNGSLYLDLLKGF